MNRLRDLHRITIELKEVLEQETTSKNRESIIEKVNLLVEQRGSHLQELAAPYTMEEKQTGRELVLINEEIQDKMQLLFNELKSEMKQMKKQKKSNRTYSNPYEKIQSLDGMFMDSKK
ncbi:flagellar protein FliT [Virgibacillus sp. C22-A2]|uniref:Flagellar protein FliT n=1 Tax=Virgibacillus tibetensis TaxID=3042313 RepID=A0ABU6KEF7_9BACI|nr:flagellar protein FliT [Virgibacillus sp. C22-A2]